MDVIIDLKHRYHSIPAIIVVLVFLAPCCYPVDLDRRLLLAIQSKTGFAPADYLMETLSLSTPFLEGGYAALRLSDGDEGAALALIASQAICLPLKYAVGRARPDPELLSYRPKLINTRITPSFPSGHAASSFALAAFLGHRFPKYRPYLFSYALLSGLSQVYVGNHFPSDALAGAAIGIISAEIALLLERAR